MSKPIGLAVLGECLVCGDDLEMPNYGTVLNPRFQGGDKAVCLTCATVSFVHVDDRSAYLSSDEDVEDLGQAKCDGKCKAGAVDSFIGKPCPLICERSRRTNI